MKTSEKDNFYQDSYEDKEKGTIILKISDDKENGLSNDGIKILKAAIKATGAFDKDYVALTDDEIREYKKKLLLPSIEFPHYEHLKIDGITVCEYLENKLLPGELFLENARLLQAAVGLKVSNYGRVKIYDKILKPEVGNNVFKHGLIVYIERYGLKSVHRLVKETFDPIKGMEIKGKYEVHHINNNGNDNRLENLIWVSPEDHRKIDTEFNIELKRIAQIIRSNKSPNFT